MNIPSILITVLFVIFSLLCAVALIMTIFTPRKCLGAAGLSFAAAMSMWTISHLG